MGKKLASVIARLDRLCSEDNEDIVWDENENRRRSKLFEWVAGINSKSPSRQPCPSTLQLIKDNGNALCDRVNTQGYEECQGDILAASGIAEDIRDALLEYQVGIDRP